MNFASQLATNQSSAAQRRAGIGESPEGVVPWALDR
jgi:hypothetical protein